MQESILHYGNLSLEDIEGESWKEVDGYENYYTVSDFGRIKSISKNRVNGYAEKILKQSLNGRGYFHVGFSRYGEVKYFSVHKLVAIAFIPNPNKKEEINHKKGIKIDNRATELEWNTHLQNIRHARETGLDKGELENHSMTTLTNEKVMEIYISNLSYKELAMKYKCSSATVMQIKLGKVWGKLTGKVYTKKENCFLKKEDVIDIFTSSNRGRFLANKYKVSEATICDIRKGRRHSNITGLSSIH